MTLTVESLGLTRDEILDRVATKIADSVMETWTAGEEDDGEETDALSPFAKILENKVLERVNQAIEVIAGRHVLPNIAAYVETLCLQETNKWGEKKGQALTFIEYLVQRADAYLREEVNYDGKTRAEDHYSAWRPAGTRVTYLVNQHLQYSIQGAMQQALKDANAAIVGGIEAAVKIKLAEVAASLKVKAEIGR